MPKTRAQQQLYAELQQRYGRALAEAFFRAVDDLRAGIELQRVSVAIENGDIDAALEALHIDPAAYAELSEITRQAYLESGRAAVQELPKRAPDGTALVVRFDGSNPEAERWLSTSSSTLVTRITEDQRQVVRDRLLLGMQKGQSPRVVALDIVGRINRASGKREGGILGLSSVQAQYVDTARDELASDDPAVLGHFLTRARRDRRFDRSITKALREEKALAPDIARKALAGYERRLLQLRGEMIGKVEVFNALAEAKDRAYWQAVEDGKIAADTVTIRWRHLSNEHPRLDHVAMNGKTIKMGERFVLPDGTLMRFPHDPSASAKHNAGCHCQGDYRVNWLATIS